MVILDFNTVGLRCVNINGSQRARPDLETRLHQHTTKIKNNKPNVQ